MRTFIKYFVHILALVLVSCAEETITLHDVITIRAGSPSVNADGSTLVRITALLPIDALPDKRMITFKTTTGSIQDSVGTTDSSKKGLVVKANKKIGKYWQAAVNYVPGLDSGRAKVSATILGYTDSVYIDLKPVQATRIRVVSDSFAVQVGFAGEVTLIGTLSSSDGNVSKDRKVKFIDTNLDGSPVGGSFRAIQNKSDEKGQVSTVYSPGLVAGGKYIYLKAIVGSPGKGRDSVKIYLTP